MAEEQSVFGDLIDFFAKMNSDFIIFSGNVYRDNAIDLLTRLDKKERRENISLLLCTFGGDPDAAYLIARGLKRRYKKFTIYITGICKSAGTLLALGADEIVMSGFGELGPLDVQMIRDDALSPRGSGLDLQNSISAIRDYSVDFFQTNLMTLKESSRGTISTKIAADIACKLAIGLLAPIMAQIDPHRLGGVQRSMTIAYDYGKRLKTSEPILKKLTADYSVHSFVIDVEEAKDLLQNVREMSAEEILVYNKMQKLFKSVYGSDISYLPSEENQIIDFETINKKIEEPESQGEKDGQDQMPSDQDVEAACDENGRDQSDATHINNGSENTGDAVAES